MKVKDCINCRWRVWEERPKGAIDTCGGCVTYSGQFLKWKRRKLWQVVRDIIKTINRALREHRRRSLKNDH